MSPIVLSRQMVLFCVERRRSWRMLQSRAGITNIDYEAQKAVLAALDGDERQGLDLVAVAVEVRDGEPERLLADPESA